MSKEGKSVFIENLSVLASPEGLQKYVFGTKKNGNPRALYDIVQDFVPGGKKKKKRKKNKSKYYNDYEEFILGDRKKKKKHKKKKHWHI